ncbi:ankyrin repeat domain-containing protein [Acrasis kona]|uniref:Ankyrin repeat domain-containing protein n=1 Tax=Acrasis kona TaxID=1008807 RepID=A0AAW2YKV5_9EUKA
MTNTPLAEQRTMTVASVSSKIQMYGVDHCDDNLWTLLHHASAAGNNKVVEYLLSQKASPNVQNKEKTGNAPLHLAASNGNIKVVTLLLDGGGDVNIANHKGETPLIISQKNKRPAVYSLLTTHSKPVLQTTTNPIILLTNELEDRTAQLQKANETIQILQKELSQLKKPKVNMNSVSLQEVLQVLKLSDDSFSLYDKSIDLSKEFQQMQNDLTKRIIDGTATLEHVRSRDCLFTQLKGTNQSAYRSLSQLDESIFDIESLSKDICQKLLKESREARKEVLSTQYKEIIVPISSERQVLEELMTKMNSHIESLNENQKMLLRFKLMAIESKEDTQGHITAENINKLKQNKLILKTQIEELRSLIIKKARCGLLPDYELKVKNVVNKESKEAKESSLCVVCLERHKSHACVPCGHLTLCESCISVVIKDSTCPVCRSKVQTCIPIYY